MYSGTKPKLYKKHQGTGTKFVNETHCFYWTVTDIYVHVIIETSRVLQILITVYSLCAVHPYSDIYHSSSPW